MLLMVVVMCVFDVGIIVRFVVVERKIVQYVKMGTILIIVIMKIMVVVSAVCLAVSPVYRVKSVCSVGLGSILCRL